MTDTSVGKTADTSIWKESSRQLISLFAIRSSNHMYSFLLRSYLSVLIAA